mmetsp:Transcript_31944/g.86608  ORF Transcript_31944/g.86608 Transcript_31944/m.86608 type:complete len:321 (+) Transcript_31944:759-1721(+)
MTGYKVFTCQSGGGSPTQRPRVRRRASQPWRLPELRCRTRGRFRFLMSCRGQQGPQVLSTGARPLLHLAVAWPPLGRRRVGSGSAASWGRRPGRRWHATTASSTCPRFSGARGTSLTTARCARMARSRRSCQRTRSRRPPGLLSTTGRGLRGTSRGLRRTARPRTTRWATWAGASGASSLRGAQTTTLPPPHRPPRNHRGRKRRQGGARRQAASHSCRDQIEPRPGARRQTLEGRGPAWGVPLLRPPARRAGTRSLQLLKLQRSSSSKPSSAGRSSSSSQCSHPRLAEARAAAQRTPVRRGHLASHGLDHLPSSWPHASA